MQYILTREELDNLIPKSKYEEKQNEVKSLQQLVLKASNYKCIYDRTKEDGYNPYCDSCPIVDFDCGKIKDFSQ